MAVFTGDELQVEVVSARPRDSDLDLQCQAQEMKGQPTRLYVNRFFLILHNITDGMAVYLTGTDLTEATSNSPESPHGPHHY